MSAVQEQVRHMGGATGAYVPKQADVRDKAVRSQQNRAAKWVNRASLAVCCLVSFGVVWLVAGEGARIYTIDYTNTNLQTQIQQQSAVNATLGATVDQLEQPSRILNVAIDQLHMEYKNPVVISTASVGQ